MCLHPQPIDPIPEDTARVAHAAFPKGTFAMRVRDVLGTIYADDGFASVYPRRGRAAMAPWRLMLVTVFQYAENLTDRQAAEAVAARIDWKYALSLPLTASGFDFSVLHDFRERVLAGNTDALILGPLLERCRELDLLAAGGKQRTDSTHVIAAIRSLNRLELVGETMRCALNSLADVAPDWVRAHCPMSWVDRYGPRIESARLAKTAAERDALVAEIGQDGERLLSLVTAADAAPELAVLPAIGILRLVWQQQYDHEPDGRLRWRTDAELLPAGELIQSPYDPDARYARKRDTTWTGGSVHLTETCDDPDRPNLITHVSSTPATTHDQDQTEQIHADLAADGVTPTHHLADSSYVDAAILAASQDAGITLVSRVPENRQWQALAGQGFDAASFAIDWETTTVLCPAGATNTSWKAGVDRDGTPVIRVGFGRTVCRSCRFKEQCTRGTHRVLTLHRQKAQIALTTARAWQTTEAFKQLYALRAGIEGTIAQGVSVCGLRYARYLGLPKMHLQHLASAVAMNLIRIVAWLARPEHRVRPPSSFQRTMAPPAAV